MSKGITKDIIINHEVDLKYQESLVFIFLWPCTNISRLSIQQLFTNSVRIKVKFQWSTEQHCSISHTFNTKDTNCSFSILIKPQLQKCHRAENSKSRCNFFLKVISDRNFPELYLEYRSAVVVVSVGPKRQYQWLISLWRPRAQKNAKTLLMLKAFPVSQIKSLFFLSLSLVRSAAKTNWCCDECSKYDRWDIWHCWPHTTRQSPGSRCCSDLQPPKSWYLPLSHADAEPCWDTVTLLRFLIQLMWTVRETGLIVPLAELCVDMWTWQWMNHNATNKTSNDF